MTRRIALVLTCAILASAAHAQELPTGRTARIGADVRVTEPLDGPLHAAGAQVYVNAPIEGNARAAAGRIELGPDAAVAGDASFAGGQVIVRGAIKNNLHAAGGQVTIDGSVGGDASVAGGTLTLGPNARIAGKLKFRGGELIRDPAAQVTGPVEHVRGRLHRHELTTGERFLRGWIWTLGLMLLAAIIAAALPGTSRRMAQELRDRPWMTPLLGFIALTAIPVAAVLLMITVIGIPLGLLAILGYVALLLVGYVWLSVVVGGMLLDRFSAGSAAHTASRVGAAALAMLALALLVRIPVIGALVTLAALVVGIGMIVAVVFRHTPQTNGSVPA
jgi:hypothetical protein